MRVGYHDVGTGSLDAGVRLSHVEAFYFAVEVRSHRVEAGNIRAGIRGYRVEIMPLYRAPPYCCPSVGRSCVATGGNRVETAYFDVDVRCRCVEVDRFQIEAQRFCVEPLCV